MYDFFEDHGITMEARVSLVLNVFMYVDDCINIEAYKREHVGKCPTLREVVRALDEKTATDFTEKAYQAADWVDKPRNEDNAAALKCEITV